MKTHQVVIFKHFRNLSFKNKTPISPNPTLNYKGRRIGLAQLSTKYDDMQKHAKMDIYLEVMLLCQAILVKLHEHLNNRGII